MEDILDTVGKGKVGRGKWKEEGEEWKGGTVGKGKVGRGKWKEEGEEWKGGIFSIHSTEFSE